MTASTFPQPPQAKNRVALPLPDAVVFRGANHFFPEIRAIDFWLAPGWAPAPGDDRLLLSFAGPTVARGSVHVPWAATGARSRFEIMLTATCDALVFYRDGKAAARVPLAVGDGQPHYVMIALYPGLGNITASVDGGATTTAQGLPQQNPPPQRQRRKTEIFDGLAFDMSEIGLGGGDRGFTGWIAGLRLWSAWPPETALPALAGWSPNAAPGGGGEPFEGAANAIVAWLDPRTTRMCFPNASLPIVGTWAENASRVTSLPTKVDMTAHGLKAGHHCLYPQVRYFAIVLDDQGVAHLVTDGGQDLVHTATDGNTYRFGDREGKSSCDVETRFRQLTSMAGGKPGPLTIQELVVANAVELGIRAGRYSPPYRRPKAESGSTWGSYFAHRIPNLIEMRRGVDITRIDPVDPNRQGRKDSRIFRDPPQDSHDFTTDQGPAVPFGLWYVPAASYESSTHSTFLTSKQSVENASQTTASHTDRLNLGYKGSVSVPDVVKLEYSVELGFRSGWNSEVTARARDLSESQSFHSLRRWYAVSHDIVLDKANLLLDGEPDPGDTNDGGKGPGKAKAGADALDPTNTFYADILALKDGSDEDYDILIEKYGTHYAVAAQFGATGGQLDKFDQRVTQHLMERGHTLGHESGFDIKASTKGNLLDGLVEGGPSGSYGQDDAKSSGSRVSSEFEKLLKTQTSTTWAAGTMSEHGVPDAQGAVCLRCHLEPISELLLPPFVDDYALMTVVRPRLIERLKNHVRKVAEKNGKVELDDPTMLAVAVVPRVTPRSALGTERLKRYRGFMRLPDADPEGDLQQTALNMGITLDKLVGFLDEGRLDDARLAKIRQQANELAAADIQGALLDKFKRGGIALAMREGMQAMLQPWKGRALISERLEMEIEASHAQVTSRRTLSPQDMASTAADAEGVRHAWSSRSAVAQVPNPPGKVHGKLVARARWVISEHWQMEQNKERRFRIAGPWESIEIDVAGISGGKQQRAGTTIEWSVAGIPVQVVVDKRPLDGLVSAKPL